jgi:hypothetical protein
VSSKASPVFRSSTEILGRARHEVVSLFDHAGEEVRQAALAYRGLGFLLVDGHI